MLVLKCLFSLENRSYIPCYTQSKKATVPTAVKINQSWLNKRWFAHKLINIHSSLVLKHAHAHTHMHTHTCLHAFISFSRSVHTDWPVQHNVRACTGQFLQNHFHIYTARKYAQSLHVYTQIRDAVCRIQIIIISEHSTLIHAIYKVKHILHNVFAHTHDKLFLCIMYSVHKSVLRSLGDSVVRQWAAKILQCWTYKSTHIGTKHPNTFLRFILHQLFLSTLP